MDPLDVKLFHCLEVAVPSSKVLLSSISTEWIEGVIFLNGEDIWALHTNAIELDLWNVSFRCKWNGGIIMKTM